MMNIISGSSRSLLAAALLATALTGCQTRRTAETGAASPAPSNAETASQPAGEKPPAIEKPALSGEVVNLSLYPVPTKRENLAISIVVALRNAGATINAQDWTLAVNTPGRSDLRGLQPVHVNGVVAMPGTAGQKVDLDKEDLVIKSKNTAIGKGTTLNGILTFVLAKTSAADLSNNNSTLQLHFKDSQGNSYQTAKTVIGAKR